LKKSISLVIAIFCISSCTLYVPIELVYSTEYHWPIDGVPLSKMDPGFTQSFFIADPEVLERFKIEEIEIPIEYDVNYFLLVSNRRIKKLGYKPLETWLTPEPAYSRKTIYSGEPTDSIFIYRLKNDVNFDTI
jgi:hypothetical protein